MVRKYASQFILTVAAFLGLVNVLPAHAASGTVYKRISGCDYFIVSSTKGYVVLEWYGGIDPDVGDTLRGQFETYGMHTLLVNDDDDNTVKVWVEDYWLDREDALEKLVDKCDD